MTDVNRCNYLIGLAIIALVVVSVFAIMRPAMIVSSPENSNQRTLTVNGTGTVGASPDEAQLNLAVNTQAPTADQATSENANAMSQVIQAILGLSSLNPVITKDDITTKDYSLTPVYSQINNCPSMSLQQSFTCTVTTQQLVGYAVHNAIQVTVKDMTSIGRVLDAATQSGVNEVAGITFTFTGNTYANLQKQALQMAVQDASNQAQTLATALGVQITGVVSVTPAYVYEPYAYAKVNAVSSETPIQTGTLQMTVNVQVVYELSA